MEIVGEVKDTGNVVVETVVLILSVSVWQTLTVDNKLLVEVIPGNVCMLFLGPVPCDKLVVFLLKIVFGE